MGLTLTTPGVPGVPGVGAGERPGAPVSSPSHCHHPPVLLTAAAAQLAGPDLLPGPADHPAVGVHTVQLQSRLSPPDNRDSISHSHSHNMTYIVHASLCDLY